MACQVVPDPGLLVPKARKELEEKKEKERVSGWVAGSWWLVGEGQV